MIETKVAEIQPGDQWLLEGAWVTVREVQVGHPDDRVTVQFEQDGEVNTLSEYRGFEVAVVKRSLIPGTVADLISLLADAPGDDVITQAKLVAAAGYRALDRDSLAAAMLAGMQAMQEADGWTFEDLQVRDEPGHEGDVTIETMGIDLCELADHVLAALDGAR